MTPHDAYRAFKQADDAWQAELERVFKSRAGNTRYTKEGKSTPRLKQLHKAFIAAGNIWRDACGLKRH